MNAKEARIVEISRQLEALGHELRELAGSPSGPRVCTCVPEMPSSRYACDVHAPKQPRIDDLARARARRGLKRMGRLPG